MSGVASGPAQAVGASARIPSWGRSTLPTSGGLLQLRGTVRA